MKNQLFLIIAIFALGCTSERTNELSGTWDATNYVKYPFDTISLESNFDPVMERVTVKTDSGIMVISHVNDSIIDISPTTKKEVLQFHFDDRTRGILSIYEIDSEQTPSNEDPRYTANNYNFSTLTQNERTYLIIDYHFGQFGRTLDTVEYQLISVNELLISKDTLTRINQR
ncbi:hypothetical protein [Reichenbachiella sp.]|uniref:hypothetical protein n=1 Tax=Reichenbachiella sp. TaxID=2184521 RepID=UPI003296983F